jgi:hypothetical protein
MLKFSHTSDTSNLNIITYHFIDNEGNYRGICVDKNINHEDALVMLLEIPIVEPVDSPLGLS